MFKNMKCPFCDQNESSVLESRDSEDGRVTRRRRECMKCKKRFTTYERVEESQVIVKKKNGEQETFDKQKIRKGLVRAFEKRPVEIEEIDEIVDRVEREMLKRKNNLVTSESIGKSVLRKLKVKDKVAYVRFASVYLDFNDLKDFTRLVKEMK